MLKLTDSHIAGLLTKQGIDPRFVGLKQDYASRSLGKEHSPYARFWEDPVSHKRIMEVGILPRVTNAGFFIVPKFRQSGNKFISEENCFGVEVRNDKSIRATCVNDQPNGRKRGDWAEWRPQVFLDGVEQTCGKPVWLETDHINPNYHFNVLEYDYGFCKRRIRIIEGRFRDRITLTSNPNTEVRVANNATGNMRLKFGSRDRMGDPIGRVIGDTEIISKEELASARYPITIGASPETFYPDAHVENSSVDGVTTHNEAEVTWATILAGAGTSADDSVTGAHQGYYRADGSTDKWLQLTRNIYLFDTSGISAIATVTGAVFSLYGYEKADTLSASPDYNVYKSTPFSNVALQADDYVDVGSTALCATPITYAAFDDAGYNNMTLTDVDTDDFGYISLTSVTKLGCRGVTHDVDGGTPNWISNHLCYMSTYTADQGNTGSDPKLVVTYIIAGVPVADGDLIGIPVIRKS